ncbi:MAG: exosortase [Sphingomicrobium sp.]
MNPSSAIAASPDDASLAKDTAAADRVDWRRLPLHAYLIIAGLLALVIPTLLALARNYWDSDNGAHGPIILISGAWLVWRERAHIHFRPGSVPTLWLAVVLPPLLLVYAYGRSFSVLTAESASLYAILVVMALFYWGPAVMRRLWFAILYLGFLIRPPSGVVAELTQPLKIWISESAVAALYWLGYPVANSGVHIQIAQYELLVQQACAGLGSIFSLLAIGLLYIHLSKRALTLRSALLILGIIPIAMFANWMRVLILLLLTYHMGDGVAQSFAHDAAGLTTFALAVVGMLALDHALGWLRAGD